MSKAVGFLSDTLSFWSLIDQDGSVKNLRLFIEIMNNNKISQHEAAEKLNIDENELGNMCAHLERLKLIKCKLSEDHSQLRLYLFTRGRALEAYLRNMAADNRL
ncbi:MAG: hypothetical protein HF981_07425 [Desulfobacteraceae bacterium]|nr:hypothetical protein [Desulfobacteraceae bacterium]MBC2750199.1 hypothetical protein [Desulfobacteraceae bacterium]